jgi:hypothetical protein
MKPQQAGALARFTRAARAWGLALAFILAAAHSVAVWHAFTHEATERTSTRSGKQLAHAEPCGLCVAAASIGGAAATSPILLLRDFAQQPPGALAEHEHLLAPERRPYAIRAPPVTHS